MGEWTVMEDDRPRSEAGTVNSGSLCKALSLAEGGSFSPGVGALLSGGFDDLFWGERGVQ